jgi:two-component system OmpR family response regulator
VGARLLVVEDEPNISALLSATLRHLGYDVRAARDGAEALAITGEYEPDLAVVDMTLPDLDGLQVAEKLRATGRARAAPAQGPAPLPVLFLTTRDPVPDRVSGLTALGDDWLAKPFSLEEVVVRVRALLRRGNIGDSGPVLRCADLELDEEAHQVRRAGQPVELSPTEFNLLRFLLSNAGRVVSKAQILDRVWSYDFGGDGRIVESYVYYLRRKLDKLGPTMIHTVRGVGYALRPPRIGDR